MGKIRLKDDMLNVITICGDAYCNNKRCSGNWRIREIKKMTCHMIRVTFLRTGSSCIVEKMINYREGDEMKEHYTDQSKHRIGGWLSILSAILLVGVMVSMQSIAMQGVTGADVMRKR